MKKLRHLLMSLLSLKMMLISHVVFGQTIPNISETDAFFKILDNSEITNADYLILNPNENRAANDTNNDSWFSEDVLESTPVTKTLGTSNNYYIPVALNLNTIKWSFNRIDGNRFSIFNLNKQQFIYNWQRWLLGTYDNISFRTSATSNDHYWTITTSGIRNLSGRPDVYLNFTTSNNAFRFSSSSNTRLYKKMTLDAFQNFVSYNGDSKTFDLLSELGGQVSYSFDSRQEGDVVANFSGERNNTVSFTGTGIIKLKATVNHQFTGSAVTHIPDYIKVITVKVFDDYACFIENFETGNNQSSGGTNNETPSVRPIANFPYWGGNVQLYKSGVRLGTTSNPKGYIVSKELTNISGTVTVEIDIKREPGTTNRKVRFGFVTLGRNNSPSYIRTNLRTDQNVSVDINSGVFQTISYTFTNVPLNSRLMIDTDSNGYRMWIENVRINCNLPTVTIWENQQWSDGKPSINREAKIREQIAENVIAKKITFETSDSIKINSGQFIRVGNNMLLGDAKLEFKKGAYLFLDETATVDKPIIYNANHKYYKNDTRIFSSPVNNQNIKTGNNAFTDSRTNVYVYHTTLNNNTNVVSNRWVNFGGNQFLKGVGLGIQRTDGPAYNSNNVLTPFTFKGKFIGIPNNGNFEINLNNTSQTGSPSTGVPAGHYSLGNPYTAPININRFIDENKYTIQQIEIWRNDNPYDYATGKYLFSDYWYVCTLAGCTSTLSEDKIDVGKGFLIKLHPTTPATNTTPALPQYNVKFTHDQKAYELTGVSSNDRQEQRKSRYILTLNKNEEELSNILIGYFDEATMDFDLSYDVLSKNVTNSIATINNTIGYSIDARPYPLDLNDIVKLKINISEDGQYKIRLKDTDGEFYEYQKIYLFDKESNEVFDLKDNNEYSFEALSGDIVDRFEIHYKNEMLGLDYNSIDSSLKIYYSNGNLYVKSNENIISYEILDITGRLLYKESGVNKKDFRINSYSKGSVIIVFETESQNKIIKKAILK